MDRRKAIKNISLSLGVAAATPTMLSVLQSCTSDIATWQPVYFSKTEGHMITHLADIILPTSDIAGALDVNVPEFMDKLFKEIVEDHTKNLYKEGASAFSAKFKEVYNKDAGDGTKEEFAELLGTYFDIPQHQQDEIFALLSEDKSNLEGKKLDMYLTYKFLTETRRYTLWGYYTSELVGETILNYDPIPGVYQACIPVEEAGNGNAWSL